jgi:hypothetical protein
MLHGSRWKGSEEGEGSRAVLTAGETELFRMGVDGVDPETGSGMAAAIGLLVVLRTKWSGSSTTISK